MDNDRKDPELEGMLKNMRQKSVPDHLMENYDEGVRLKIKARKEFVAFYGPLLVMAIVIACLGIAFAVLSHQFQPKEAKIAPTPAVRQAQPQALIREESLVPAETTTDTRATAIAALAAIHHELTVLEALGEDSAEEIIATMNADQLAEDIVAYDRFEMIANAQKPLTQATPKV